MHAPVISISMPAYNVEKYIGEAIESIVAQTFTDWELIQEVPVCHVLTASCLPVVNISVL